MLSTPSGLLSLPIGVAGNLTQFMAAAGLKTAQGIRPGAPLFLSQVGIHGGHSSGDLINIQINIVLTRFNRLLSLFFFFFIL